VVAKARGWTPGSVLSPALSPSALGSAAAAARTAGSVRVTTAGTIRASDGTITTTIEGAYASRSRSGSTDVTIANVKLRVLFTPILIYLQYPEQMRARVSQGKAWLSAPLASLLSAKGLAELGQDPAQQLDALARLRNPKVHGRERIDGVDTTDFRGTLDLSHVFDQFATFRASSCHGASTT